MNISVDHFTKTGYSHKVCEDYIISGQKPVPHIILADGCSASEKSEMGARILTYMARQFLNYRSKCLDKIEYFDMGNWIIHNAENIARWLGLNRSCLDSTLIIAYLWKDRIFVHVYGDGFIFFKIPGEDIKIIPVTFSCNAPYYLSYRIDPDRKTLYKNNDHCINIGKHSYPFHSPVSRNFEIETGSILMVASDGIDTFIDDSGRKKKPHDLLADFIQFKNFKGAFLKRRMKKAIQMLENKGFKHYDDISAGVFLIQSPE